MSSDCIFCKIIAGEIPAERVYQDDEVIAILDLNPQAPNHILVMPRRHYADIAEFSSEAEADEVGRLVAAASKIGRESGPGGFRIVVNSGVDGGQTVDHLHLHVLSGRHMNWPPG